MAIGNVRQLKCVFSEKIFSLEILLILCTSFLIAILLSNLIHDYQEVGVSAS